MEEKKKKEEEEDEQNWSFYVLVLLTLLKVSGTYRVDLAIEQQIVCKLFELLCFIFWEFVPYV